MLPLRASWLFAWVIQMAKSLSDLGVDHEYAPGAEPDPPSFVDLFIAWISEHRFPYLEDVGFIGLLMLAVFCFLRFCQSVGRVWRVREEMERQQEVLHRQRMREATIAEARARLAARTP